MKRNIFYILIVNTIVLVSCISTKNFVGTYRSNFAELGFFITRLKLNSDSTFEYKFRGDMIYDTASGHYRVYHRKLILTYYPRPLDTTGLAFMDSVANKIGIELSASFDDKRPHIYYLGNKKLFESIKDGIIVKKAFGYSKTKKYLLFGSHYYKHNHYLMQVP